MNFWANVYSDSIISKSKTDRLDEIELRIPSYFTGVPELKSCWFLLPLNIIPEQSHCEKLQRNSYKIKLTDGELRKIIEAIPNYEYVYLLFATPKLPITELSGASPFDRFSLFCIDLKQFLIKFPQTVNEVSMPVSNEINLSIFTLLWSSQWVDSFFKPLSKLIIDVGDITSPLLQVAFPSKEHVHKLGNSENWKEEFMKSFNLSKPSIRALGGDDLLSRISMGYSMQDIVQKLWTTPDIKQILTYAPEALQGTVSFWLFARFYQQFMFASSNENLKEMIENIRYIPFDIEKINQVPRVIRRAILLLQQFYKKLRVETRIVTMPKQDPLNDRSFYDKIGRIPWVDFSDDGKFELQNPSRITVHEGRDFLNNLKDDGIIVGEENIIEAHLLLGLTIEEVNGLTNLPHLLFVKENDFIRYPRLLFSKG
jgi:hypothetical protein